jgi:hypothetical protein
MANHFFPVKSISKIVYNLHSKILPEAKENINPFSINWPSEIIGTTSEVISDIAFATCIRIQIGFNNHFLPAFWG